MIRQRDAEGDAADVSAAPDRVDAAAVLDSATDGIVAFDRAWRFTYLNNRARALLPDSGDLLGITLWERFPQARGGDFEAACRKVMTSRSGASCETFGLLPETWIENDIRPCGDGISVFFRDVTTRKRHAQQLHDGEARFAALFTKAPFGVVICAPGGHLLAVNDRFAEFLGYAKGELIGSDISRLVHADDVATSTEAYVRLVKGDSDSCTLEKRYIRRDGSIVWGRGTSFMVRDVAPGATPYSLGIIEDIGDRRAMEEALRDKANDLEAVIESVPSAVWIAHDPDCRVITGNRAGEEMLRLSRGGNASMSAQGGPAPRHFKIFSRGVELEPSDLPLQSAAATGKTFRQFPQDIVFDDGTVKHVYGNTAPLLDSSGKIRGAVGAFIDITEMVQAREALTRSRAELEQVVAERTRQLVAANDRLQAEIADRERAEIILRESEERHRSLYNRTPMALHSVDGTAAIIDVNDHWLQLMGYERDEAMGRSPADFMIEELARRYRELAWPDMLDSRGTIRNFEYRFVRKSGETFDGLLSSRGEWDAEGRFIRTWAVIADITAQRQAETQLMQAQKMEVVGQLTGGVAHDFNNLLTIISGNLELIESSAGEPIRRMAGAALRATERGTRLTQHLLAFSRLQRLHPETVNVQELAVSFESFLRRAVGESVTVEIVADQPLWPCDVDPTHLETALLNLALNARDAMPEGGRLTLALRNVTLGPKDFIAELATRDCVAVTVSDTGRGMTPEVAARACDPFFTTKDVGKGTGLGLSMVYGFVKQSGGHLVITSEPDVGTRITLYLPRKLDAAAATARNVRFDDDCPTGTETILVTEDDPDVLDVTSIILADLGYRLRTARTGSEALDILESDPGIDLLLSDVVMPGGVNGVELARAARALRPDLRILLVSGYAEKVLARQHEPDSFPIIGKPLHQAVLARAIRKLLEQERG